MTYVVIKENGDSLDVESGKFNDFENPENGQSVTVFNSLDEAARISRALVNFGVADQLMVLKAEDFIKAHDDARDKRSGNAA